MLFKKLFYSGLTAVVVQDDIISLDVTGSMGVYYFSEQNERILACSSLALVSGLFKLPL